MVDPANPVSKLRDLRDSIDNIDAAIVHMLAERFRCTRAVGKLKAQHGLPSREHGIHLDCCAFTAQTAKAGIPDWRPSWAHVPRSVETTRA